MFSLCARSPAHFLRQALSALASFSKGFPPAHTASPFGARARPALASAFATSFAAALAAALRAPRRAARRAARPRATALLHRGVEALGEGVLPLLPDTLSAVLSSAEGPRDVTELLLLLAQLAARFRAPLAPLLAPALPAVEAAALAAAAPADAAASASGTASPTVPEEVREAREAWRAWQELLLALATHGCAGVLLQHASAPPPASASASASAAATPSAPPPHGLLLRLAHDAGSHPEVALRRKALAALGALLRDAATSAALASASASAASAAFASSGSADAAAGGAAAAFARFAVDAVGLGACLAPLLRGDLDVGDAATGVRRGSRFLGACARARTRAESAHER
jgi:hypothetical protein